MKKKILLIVLFVVSYLLLSISLPVLAQDPCACTLPKEGFLVDFAKLSPRCICCGDCQLIDFFRIGRIIIQGFLGVIGVYALIYSIVGGIMMIISSGKQEKILQGKRMIGFSLIGLIVAFLAWQIVNLVICGVTQGKLQETCTIFGQPWNQFPQ